MFVSFKDFFSNKGVTNAVTPLNVLLVIVQQFVGLTLEITVVEHIHQGVLI